MTVQNSTACRNAQGDANSVRFTWRLANGDADGRTIFFRVFKR